MDPLDALYRNALTSYNRFILLWSQEHECLFVFTAYSNFQHQEVVIHYIFKESVNLQSLLVSKFLNKVKMILKKIVGVRQDSNP